MNWLDWLILGVLALSSLQGLRYGLLISIARLAGSLLGIWAAFAFYRPLAQYLSFHWGLDEKVLPLVEGVLKLWFPAGGNQVPDLPPGRLIFFQPAAAAIQMNPLGDYLARTLAAAILEAACFLALLLATAWAAGLAGRILSRIADISFLGPLNRLGGLVFGAFRGLVIVFVILVLLSPFQTSGFQPDGRQLPGKSFQESKLLPYFYPLLNAAGRPLPGVAPWRGNSAVTGSNSKTICL